MTDTAEGSRADVAYQFLKDRILAADFEPDSVIDEKRVAAELGMSRTPVRQAIGRLVPEGFVRVLPQRGTLVGGLSVADIEQVYLLRCLVEPAGAAMAARRASDADVAELESMDRAYFAGTSSHLNWHLHTQFHRAVVALAGIPRLTKIVTELQEQSQWFLAVRDKQGGRLPTPSRHRMLIDAIAARDPQRAFDVSRTSILTSRKEILRGAVADAELLLMVPGTLSDVDLSRLER